MDNYGISINFNVGLIEFIYEPMGTIYSTETLNEIQRLFSAGCDIRGIIIGIGVWLDKVTLEFDGSTGSRICTLANDFGTTVRITETPAGD